MIRLKYNMASQQQVFEDTISEMLHRIDTDIDYTIYLKYNYSPYLNVLIFDLHKCISIFLHTQKGTPYKNSFTPFQVLILCIIFCKDCRNSSVKLCKYHNILPHQFETNLLHISSSTRMNTVQKQILLFFRFLLCVLFLLTIRKTVDVP